jgi:hypothetical protein
MKDIEAERARQALLAQQKANEQQALKDKLALSRNVASINTNQPGQSFAGGVQGEAQRMLDTQKASTVNPVVTSPTPTNPVQTGSMSGIIAGTPTTPTANDLVSIRNGEVYIGGSIDPNMTPEQKQKYITQYGTEQDKINYSAGQIGGDPTKIITAGNANTEAMTRLEQNIANQKAQAEIKKQQEEATRRQQQEAISRTQSAVETRFLTGREGVQANEGLGKGIALGVTRQLDDISRQADSFRLAVDESAKQLEYYQKTNQTALAKAESERLTELQTKANKAAADVKTADTEAKKAEANIAKQQADATVSAFNSLDSFSPTMLGNMTASDITSYITNAGGKIDPISAEGYASTYRKIGELAQSKNADDQAQAALQRRQLMVNIHNSQQTEATKAIQGATALNNAITNAKTPEEKAMLEGLKVSLGYAEKEEQPKTITIGNDVYSYDPKTNEATKIIGRGVSVNIGGFKSGEGMRTDRHNNPTAFTTDIAKQAGLVEGVDYVAGDPFSGGVTAKLLGDPIETTIKVIDKIGFQTAKGNQRWSHTNYSKDQWDKMTHEEKIGVVGSMYQKEGGNGSLIGLYTKDDNQEEKNADLAIIGAGSASPTFIEGAKERAIDGGYTEEFISMVEQAKNKPLSGEAAKLKELGEGGLRQVKELRNLITKTDGTFDKSRIAQGAIGLDRSVSFIIDDLSDQVGRLRSGGAITADEEARFLRLLPGVADTVFGSDFDIERKLKEIELKFGGITSSLSKTKEMVDPIGLGIDNDPMGILQ